MVLFDMLYKLYSGFSAYRNTDFGSWYVLLFVYVCTRMAHTEDLVSMMTRVLIIFFVIFLADHFYEMIFSRSFLNDL
jgi:hypothetical protein